MQGFERLGEAFSKMALAVGECVAAFAECISEITASLSQGEFALMLAAYNAAEKERREWIHRAKYSKKKRIRKKYHDKIMRAYKGG